MYKIIGIEANKVNYGLISGTSRSSAFSRWCLLLCFLLPVIGSLSLKPPAEEILNNHLCPNPVLSATSKLFPSELSKILPLRLQPRTGTNLYSSRIVRPCTFFEDPTLSYPPSSPSLLQSLNVNGNIHSKNATVVRIQSISLNVSPWNFSTASGECSKFIMFRSWSEYGNGYPVMCGRENLDFDQFLVPYGHPMILYYHLREEGMSFPLFHPNGPLTQSSSFASQASSRREFPRGIFELRYMFIYYSLRTPEGKWTCRLQQYKLMQDACPSSPSISTICGEYQCKDLDALIYQKKISGDGMDYPPQRFILVKSKTQEKYRVRNFLRQKFVPILFLVMLICAYKTYMKAGLRLHDQMPMSVSDTRLGRYSSQRHHHFGRDPFRDIYFDSGSDDNNIPVGIHIPYEPSSPLEGGERMPRGDSTLPDGTASSCSHGELLVHPTDLPPSYDTLFPPSYNELFYSTPATTTESSVTATATAETKYPKA